MREVIVVTGVSSGFGALTARALAHAGHVVHASMLDTKGHNGAENVAGTVDRVRAEFLRRVRLADLLSVNTSRVAHSRA